MPNTLETAVQEAFLENLFGCLVMIIILSSVVVVLDHHRVCSQYTCTCHLVFLLYSHYTHSLTHSQLLRLNFFLYFSASLDLKSLALNLASFIIFFFPIGCYFYTEYIRHMLAVIGVWSMIAYLTPPIGFLRPHPYSDSSTNRPMGSRNTNNKRD
jgi:hypothetical protein